MSRIVEVKDRKPLVLRKSEMEREAVAVCRCGLAAAWPFCDGSHTKATDEESGELYAYVRNDQGELERREVEALEQGEADPRAGIPRES